MIAFSRFFASFAGIGFLPFAPGTWGSLAAALILFFFPLNNLIIFAALIGLLSVLGAVASHIIEKNEGLEDPGWIVIDEVVGMWIALFALPHNPVIFFVAFILFRFFDIKKPWLIDKIQSVAYGWGVMLDDILAGFAALLINVFLIYIGIYT